MNFQSVCQYNNHFILSNRFSINLRYYDQRKYFSKEDIVHALGGFAINEPERAYGNYCVLAVRHTLGDM